MSSMHLLPQNIYNETVFLNPNQTLNPNYGPNVTTVSNRGIDGTSVALINFDDTEVDNEKEESFCLGSSIGLCQQFFETIQKYGTNDENIFEMLTEFELLCCDHLMVTSNLIKSKVRNTEETQNMAKLENLLRLERNSWRIFKSINEDKKLFATNDAHEDMIVDDIVNANKMSDKKLIEKTFERNSVLRQMQVVIDWLERNQLDDNEDVANDRVQFYSEGFNTFPSL